MNKDSKISSKHLDGMTQKMRVSNKMKSSSLMKMNTKKEFKEMIKIMRSRIIMKLTKMKEIRIILYLKFLRMRLSCLSISSTGKDLTNHLKAMTMTTLP